MAALYEFLNRRDTYANWQNNNVVLPDGVLGVITDSPTDELWLLMGDGVTHVKDLKTWKLYQDTVRSSKPVTLSQLTIKSDGTNAPFTILDKNSNVLYVVNPDGNTRAQGSDGKTLLRYGPGAPFAAVSGDNVLSFYPDESGALEFSTGSSSDNVLFLQDGNFILNFSDGSSFHIGKDDGVEGTWMQLRAPSGDVFEVFTSSKTSENSNPFAMLTLNGKEMYYISPNDLRISDGKNSIDMYGDNGTQINGKNISVYSHMDAYGGVTSYGGGVDSIGAPVTGLGVVNNLTPSTVNRPTGSSDPAASVGMQCFDTDLGKPIWCKAVDANGNATWVDSTGAVV